MNPAINNMPAGALVPLRAIFSHHSASFDEAVRRRKESLKIGYTPTLAQFRTHFSLSRQFIKITFGL